MVGDFSPKVPLVIVDPRRAGGCVVEKTVRTVDVAPTLLDLTGIAKPPNMDGESLEPFLDGKDSVPDLPAFAETGMWLTDLPGMPEGHLRYPSLFDLLEVPDPASGTLAIKPEYRARIIEAKDRMIRSGRWKLVYQPLESGYQLRLFDLDADPECQVDVLDRYPETASHLRQALLSWIAED